MKKKLLIFWVLLFGALTLPTFVFGQVVVERSTEIVTISDKQYYMHHVKSGETLYSISRVYQVSEAEIIRLNPEINDLGLQADMVIGIPVVNQQSEPVIPSEPDVPSEPVVTTQPVVTPDITLEEGDEFGDGYIIYTVKESERTSRLLRRWDVDEDDFRLLNPTVGSRVFVGQKILIPYEGATTQQEQPQEPVTEPDTLVNQEEPVLDTVVEEPLSGPYILPEYRPDWCYGSLENKSRHYHVALLVPLYLGSIDKIDASKEKAEKSKHSRAMKFLQFYEGFMMAADSLTKNYGLHLDLTVIDVHENTATAEAAISQLEKQPVDLIVGPFFSKSFAMVQQYASTNNILIVNPMSERESIIVNAPNVLKLKPSAKAMAEELSDLIRLHYPKAKVTLMTSGSVKDSAMIAELERILDTTVMPEVLLRNEEMLDLIIKESARRKMGKRVLSTLEVEGQIFSTKALGEHPEGEVYFENQFRHLTFSEVETFKKNLSSARDNVLIAYGDNIVFATTILTSNNKSAQKYPITLIGLPDWEEFDNLLVPNLLNLNAMYFSKHFVNYNDSITLKFVDDFRSEYESEPMEYAFEGFDVGWYFLNALMEFGPQPLECLPYYHIPLLHTRFYFNKRRYEDGYENRYWNVYQYDRPSVELKPVWVYEEEEYE